MNDVDDYTIFCFRGLWQSTRLYHTHFVISGNRLVIPHKILHSWSPAIRLKSRGELYHISVVVLATYQYVTIIPQLFSMVSAIYRADTRLGYTILLAWSWQLLRGL